MATDGEPETDRHLEVADALANRPRRAAACSGEVAERPRLPSLAGSAAMSEEGAGAGVPAVTWE